MLPAVPQPSFPVVLWHHCPDCEVSWRGHDDECWSCGNTVRGRVDSAPRVTSQGGTGCAMTEGQWATVRREIGLD